MANEIRRVCVFCGSRPGARPEYMAEAARTGRELAARRIGLVYGGASVGVMRAVADAAHDAGGEVIGVIPRGLVDKEVANMRLADLRVVGTMHERKAMMADLCDAVIALPGGFGTFDELFEILTWAQLGMHQKPVGLLNTARFYDPLVAFIDHVIAEGFVPIEHRRLVVIDDSIGSLLDALARHEPPPPAKKWIDKEEV
jgi:uncharacterized protein (TIGR00730 family)